MSFLMVKFIQYFILQLVLTRVTGLLKFISTFNSWAHRFYLQHSKKQVEKPTHGSRLSSSHLSFTNKTTDDYSVRGDDLELLMTDLGVFSHPGGEKLPEVLNSTYIFNIFEAEQSRLDEVKEAFDVFDENKDGFIDAGELQRVLCVLGLKGSADMGDCRKMIRAFDANADGRIDFGEFVKFMENTLC
ncbi:putative EF-hand domain pair protein CML [Helianthus anomalus]